MFFFSGLSTIGGFIIGSAVVGFCYGACLSLFPATAADYWGTHSRYSRPGPRHRSRRTRRA
jgi:hypothetical protein